jgi:hypothetical protein
MKDAYAKTHRAQRILELIDKLARKLPEDMSQEERNAAAMRSLDEKVGDMWREEVEKAGLELPEAEGSSDVAKERDGVECMYKKIKALLEDEGVHTESMIPRVNGEDEGEKKVKKKVMILLRGDE